MNNLGRKVFVCPRQCFQLLLVTQGLMEVALHHRDFCAEFWENLQGSKLQNVQTKYKDTVSLILCWAKVMD